jgi:hypothetical protein
MILQNYRVDSRRNALEMKSFNPFLEEGGVWYIPK